MLPIDSDDMNGSSEVVGLLEEIRDELRLLREALSGRKADQ